jgi:hypothetical protein
LTLSRDRPEILTPPENSKATSMYPASRARIGPTAPPPGPLCHDCGERLLLDGLDERSRLPGGVADITQPDEPVARQNMSRLIRPDMRHGCKP